MSARSSAKARAQNLKRRSRELGLALKSFPRRLGLSPDDFAADIGSSSLYVLKAEAGLEEFDIEFLSKCAHVFNLELEQVFAPAIANWMMKAG